MAAAAPCSFLMDSQTLRRQFHHVVSLASLAYIFSGIHALQYSLLDYDTMNGTEDLTNQQPDASSSQSDFTSTLDTSQASATGRWSDQEIVRLLDFVEAHCSLNTSRGISLKKTHFNKARDTVKSKDASQCHYKWTHLCRIYKAISLWDKKSGSGWHYEYGVNARTTAEKEVFEEWVKSPDHGPLKPFATKAWPYYRRMQGFMPGAQPRGTHSFHPGSSSESSLSASLALDTINAETDGEEDQAGPPVDSPLTNMPAAFTSAMATFFPSTPAGDSDAVSLGGSTSQSDVMPPPRSSSIAPTLSHAQSQNLSVSSAHTTSSDAQTTSTNRKRKREAAGDMPPPMSKRSSKSKGRTENLNPVIISNQLNSTLNRLADIMDKQLDATLTATSAEAATSTLPSSQPLSSQPLSMPSQQAGPPSTSDSETLDKALGIVSADKDFYSEDDLLAASLLFSDTSNDVIRIARNFITLSNTPSVQHRFLLQKIREAGLQMGKGKGKANDDDFPMLG